MSKSKEVTPTSSEQRDDSSDAANPVAPLPKPPPAPKPPPVPPSQQSEFTFSKETQPFLDSEMMMEQEHMEEAVTEETKATDLRTEAAPKIYRPKEGIMPSKKLSKGKGGKKSAASNRLQEEALSKDMQSFLFDSNNLMKTVTKLEQDASVPVSSHKPLAFRTEELLAQKRKLKSVNQHARFTPVKLGRKLLLEDYDWSMDYLPLHVVTVSIRNAAVSSDLVSLDFSGIEQLTDFLLYILKLGKTGFPSMQKFSAIGCVHLTDQGVTWLCELFPKLYTVELQGCSKVTEKGLYTIAKSLKQLNKIGISATNISRLPSKLAETKVDSALVAGCPIISLSRHFHISSGTAVRAEVTDAEFVPLPDFKVVIMRDESIDVNISSLFTDSKPEHPFNGFLYTKGWKLDPSLKFEGRFNIMEVEAKSPMADSVLSPGSIVIIAFRPQKTDGDRLYHKLACQVAAVLAKCRDVMITLLAVQEDKDTVAVEDIMTQMKEKLQHWKEAMSIQFLNERKLWRLECVDFVSQISMAAGATDIEVLHQMLEEDDLTIISLSKTSPNRKILHKHIHNIQGMMSGKFPWLFEEYSRDMLNVSSEVRPKTYWNLNKVFYNMDDDAKKVLSKKNNYQHVGKLLETMNRMGTLLYYPDLKDCPCLSDLHHLQKVMHGLISSTRTTVNIKCLGPEVQAWEELQLKRYLESQMLTAQQIEGLKIWLQKIGVLMKFSAADSAVECYVLTSDLPTQPVVDLTHFWSDACEDNTLQGQKFYTFLPGIPPSLFPAFIRKCMKLFPPLLVWKNGILFQQGPVYILAELLTNIATILDGSPVAVLSARIPCLTTAEFKTVQYARSCMFSVLNIVNHIMDSLLRKYNVYALVTTACNSCLSKKDYKMALRRDEIFHFDVPSVLAGHDRGLRCKYEKLKNNAKIRADLPILLGENIPSIAPYHNYSYMAATNPIVENGPPSEDQDLAPFKKIPVSARIKRCCICQTGQDHLCHHCGMCRKCVVLLAKIEHSTNPSFVTPSIMAIRDVSRTKEGNAMKKDQFILQDHLNIGNISGCILWPNKGMEYHILQPMTPVYFNHLVVKAVKGANIYIWITVNGFEHKIEYSTLSGAISDVYGEVEKEDEWKCLEGSTVDLKLMLSESADMTDIVFYLCGEEIWRRSYTCSEVFLKIRSEITGCVILQMPGIKRRQGSDFTPGMQVGISSSIKDVKGLRIGRVDIGDPSAAGLLRLKPVHTPVTNFLVEVKTGDLENCGTTANIHIQLFGDKGPSDVIPLKRTSDGMFQQGSIDSFQVQTSDIGMVTSVKLGHDGMSKEEEWYVISVMISSPDLNLVTTFSCNCWLSAHRYEKEVERTFHAQASHMTDTLQEHFSPLSDKLEPIGVQQWREITGNKNTEESVSLAPLWLFNETQLKSSVKALVPREIPDVNQLIMPCTDVPLPSVVWCRMMKMRDTLERSLFMEANVDYSGASNVLLPEHVTEREADHPSLRHLASPTNMHALCYVRGDMNTVMTLRPTYTLPDYMRFFWTAHIVKSKGFPFQFDHDDLSLVPVLWAWTFVLALNKQFELSDYKDIFPGGDTILPSHKVTSFLEAYLTGMCYYLFLALDPDFSVDFFGSEDDNSALARAVGSVRYHMLEQFNKTNLVQLTTLFGEDEIYLCEDHVNAWQANKQITAVPVEKLSNYCPYLLTVHIGGNKLPSVPGELFTLLPNLADFDMSTNLVRELPEEIGQCTQMLNLSLFRNLLTELPDSVGNLTRLNRLDISNNRMISVPPCISKLTNLTCLYMKTMQLTSLPEDIGNLKYLEKFYLNENCIYKLPDSFTKLQHLQELGMNGVSWVKIKSSTILSKQNFESTLRAANLQYWLDANEQDKSAIFQYFDENTNGTLEPKEIAKLNATIFYTFPRFGYMGVEPPDDDTPSGFPEQLLELKKLEYLSLQYQGLVSIPENIDRLPNLKVLNLSHNPYLLYLSAETGKLPLKRLELDECPLLKTPPKEIRAKGFSTTYAYLRRLLSGSVDCKRTKLMMVGLGGAGKTSLVKALMSGSYRTRLTVGEDITDGIDICPWTVSTDEGKVTYSVWDFAGQTVYYNTHQFFLSDRAIYVLLWNIRLGHEHAGLNFWLSSISVHAPKAPIFVVGSHVDQVSKMELPVKELQLRYPQIAGFHFVSSHTGQGVKELQDDLLEVTLQQSYMGEKIPGVWLSFEEQIKRLNDRSVIEYKELEKKANLSGIFSQSEVYQAIQFLHELGSVQYFTNEYLKAYVVINPQWIVDVMACVVSVKDSHIKDGRLRHEDIEKVWKDYPESLHSWMLRLTEEFDLTFQLASQDANLVPCLLPEKEPEINWPSLDKNGDIRETKMVYKFDYLPAGLFNRGQVRLHQFSDSSLIWKRGSFLRKNKHICLIRQLRESELLVQAQGPRPENIVFMVHEVFETLIAESFHGVTYDYYLPCPDCAKLLLKDPHMFAASTIRRATELRAPFLQCLKYFHTVSLVEMQGLMPPDSNADYDIHLVQAVQGLKELSKDVVADIFVSYCNENTAEDRSKNVYIQPGFVCGDLEKAGFRCWYKGARDRFSLDEMAKALMDAECMLVFISNEYVKEEECCNLFKYAKLTLRKPIVLVVVGSGMQWKSSRLGILLADEVFVSMQKVEQYRNKFDDLLKVVQVKLKKDSDEKKFPPCFISYCWKNSAEAVSRGTRAADGAVGFGDPRAIKKYLDTNGVECWLDVERVGLHGLFEDITEGLQHANVVIVCISDEYADSSNCCMEYRYAANTLGLPVVLAVVGTGNKWRASEIGILSLNYPMVSFQDNSENAYKTLLDVVKSLMPDTAVDAQLTLKQAKENTARNNDLSYQELCELAQRKFLRQIIQYTEEHDVAMPYPRLFLIDFVKQDVESEETPEDHTVHRTSRDFYKHPMCVQILCEHEQGWHSAAEPIPLTFNVTSLERSIPYIARITAIARYSKQLVLNCLGSETGRDFIKWIEESPQVVNFADFGYLYRDLRQEVILADPERTMGGLARCHLPNGKIVWLCEEHRKQMRVNVLSDEVTVMSHTSADMAGVDFMLQAMKELDYKQVPAAIRGLAGHSTRTETHETKVHRKKDAAGAESVTSESSNMEKLGEGAERDDPATKEDESATKQDDSDRSSVASGSLSPSQVAQQTLSPALRGLKTRKSTGRTLNRTKSRACIVM